jgi:anti-anti-sigma factor
MGEDTATLVAEAGHPQDGHVIVRLRGEFDLAGVDAFTSAVRAASSSSPMIVEIDLGDVGFIDSSGVGAIVVAARSLAAQGAQVRIGARSRVVDRVLEVSGLEAVLGSSNSD